MKIDKSCESCDFNMTMACTNCNTNLSHWSSKKIEKEFIDYNINKILNMLYPISDKQTESTNDWMKSNREKVTLGIKEGISIYKKYLKKCTKS